MQIQGLKLQNIHSDQCINKEILFLGLLAIGVLTLLVGYSYYWNTHKIDNETINLALSEARSNWNKDSAFRLWATRHGGIYVQPDERTPPNPYLAHLPHRDLVTTDGIALTLMNPAYMMRQMTEEFADQYGVRGKITGKLQLNPDNKPDEWQFRALTQFEIGASEEFFEQQKIGGKPFLRYMKPMYMTEGCVTCHGQLGYKTGDLRGGVSLSIPLAPYITAAEDTKKSIVVTHLGLWLLGVMSIIGFVALIRLLLIEMAHKAMHDVLTQLPNLDLFKNRLEQALAKYRRDNSNTFSICFMDLDNFKNLNDSYGHAIGDHLLIELANRLKSLLRPGDTVARMGGDEFTLLLDNVSGVEESLLIAGRILETFKTPFQVGNEEFYSNASIGICMSSMEYQTGAEMIRNADIAMYRAKQSGRGRIDVFNPEMHQFAQETMQIEHDLRTAIANHQLSVFYQPVVDARNNIIEGFEALLRWQHPTMGYISPDRFVPIAESTGQIKKLGRWVLEHACLQIQQWNQCYSPDRPLSIAVNFSGAEIVRSDIVETIDEVLYFSGVSPAQLHVEVTETMLVAQKTRARESIEKIRKTGVSVSIDDFGKGYCSLTYLQDFDFDILKIDKDFVQDMEGEGKGLQLVRMLTSLAEELDMKVVAEGVETKEQLDLLIGMKCSLIQGYYFSCPLTANEIEKLLIKGVHTNAKLLLDQK